MAGINSGEIRVAGSGHIYCAPLGTTLPTDATTAWNAAFVDLGYADNGFKMTQDLKTADVTAWQTLEAVRLINQSLMRTFAFTLLQTNINTLPLAWGGATLTGTTGNKYALTMPSAATVAAYAWGIDWTDGVTTQRIVIPNGVFASLPEITYGREDAVNYDFSVRALVPAAGGGAVLAYGVDAAVQLT